MLVVRGSRDSVGVAMGGPSSEYPTLHIRPSSSSTAICPSPTTHSNTEHLCRLENLWGKRRGDSSGEDYLESLQQLSQGGTKLLPSLQARRRVTSDAMRQVFQPSTDEQKKGEEEEK